MDRIRNALLRVNRTCKDAVMFDIDDTLIDSDTGQSMHIIIQLLRFCKDLAFKVVIMTARSRLAKEYTQQQLDLHDIPYDVLMFIPANLKSRAKRELGMRFVLSVRDRESDCGESVYALKLPGNILKPTATGLAHRHINVLCGS